MKRLMLMFFIVAVGHHIDAQTKKEKKIQLTGLVTDFENTPVQKCIIFIDSAKTTTRTNRKGVYKIKIPSTSKSIAVFSEELGMLIKAFIGGNTMDFRFPETTNPLTEKDLAASGFRINTSGTKNYGNYNTIYDLIKTEFSGVTVQGNKINIRGSSTLQGNRLEPLYLVDDSYVDNLDFVNTNEIRSIEILKAEDATIYGVRGGNGVIIVHLIK